MQVRDEDGARMVALLDRDASDDIDFDEFRKFVCLLPQSQVCLAVHCLAMLCHAFQLTRHPSAGISPVAVLACNVLAHCKSSQVHLYVWALLNALMGHSCGHARQILSPTRIIRNWIDCADWVSATEYRLCMVRAALHP